MLDIPVCVCDYVSLMCYFTVLCKFLSLFFFLPNCSTLYVINVMRFSCKLLINGLFCRVFQFRKLNINVINEPEMWILTCTDENAISVSVFRCITALDIFCFHLPEGVIHVAASKLNCYSAKDKLN